MIVDVHHHLIPQAMSEEEIIAHGRYYYKSYGGGARSEGINVTAAEISQRFADCIGDPDGEKVRRRMAESGVDITLMCVVDELRRYASDDEALAANRNLAELARKHDGKVLAIAGVDPRRKAAPEMLRRCLEEYGMIGLKWHCDLGYWPNDEAAYAVLKVAERAGVPLLTHTGPLPASITGEQRWAKYADVRLLDEVAQHFPGLKIIAAHMGHHDWRAWAAIAQFRPNVYGDLAMWQAMASASYDRFCRDLRTMLDIAGADSILFGGDAPGFTAMMPNEQFIAILKGLPHNAPPDVKFTEEEVAAILGGTAQKVFGLQ